MHRSQKNRRSWSGVLSDYNINFDSESRKDNTELCDFSNFQEASQMSKLVRFCYLSHTHEICVWD